MIKILKNFAEGGLTPAGLKGLASARLKSHGNPFNFEANHLQVTFKETCTLKEVTEA